jgi:hypothetical protein
MSAISTLQAARCIYGKILAGRIACVTKRTGGDRFQITAFSLVALNERN